MCSKSQSSELRCEFEPNHSHLQCIDIIRNGEERPAAFIVRKTGQVSKQELLDLIKKNFARHKWLTAGVHWIDELPRTASGKIMRRNLPKITSESIVKL